VLLRPIAQADIDVWFRYLSRPEVYEHTSWSVQDSKELMHYVANEQAAAPISFLRFAIAAKSSNELVGTAGFHTISASNRSAEIAYDLSPSYWGKGVAGATCSALVTWAHAHACITRVQATVLDSNVRSISVLERCGFQKEGLLRAYRNVRGRPGNFYMFAHVADVDA
jgi:[ribosomal protein S5]-alanine N-acetyltransferase